MNKPNQANQLYQQYSEIIRVYLMRFVNKSDAQDLTQEVFLKVSKKLNTFRGDSSIKTWIYRIATNTVKDFLKSKAYQNSKKHISISETELEAYDISLSTNLSVAEELDAEKMNECIREFIHRLPVNYSSVLVLSEIVELNNKEVSDVLNISTGTVKVRLHRARARLKKELDGGCVISIDSDDKMSCKRK